MKNLLSIKDIENEVVDILNLAIDFKAGNIEDKPLKGKSLAMIFH